MPVSADELVLPVLAVNPLGDVNVVDDVEHLRRANALALRQGYYECLQYIQRDGQAFRVESVVAGGPYGPLLGIRFMKPRLVRIRMTLEPTGRYTLDQIKDIVVEAMAKRADIWTATLDYVDIADLEAKIRASSTVDEIIKAVT